MWIEVRCEARGGAEDSADEPVRAQPVATRMVSRRGKLSPIRRSKSSPRSSVVRYAADPIGNPTAFNHSPYSTSMGTLIFAVSAVTVADEMIWNGSGIAERVRFGRFVDVGDEAVRDLRAMVSPYIEVTVLAFACEVTDRAGLAGRNVHRRAPKDSPTRSAVDVRGCAARRLRRKPMRACCTFPGRQALCRFLATEQV
jgi:hypothetical protein